MRCKALQPAPYCRRWVYGGRMAKSADAVVLEVDGHAVTVSHPGKVLTHRMLLQRVWGAEYGDESEYLRVFIGRLRRKLETDSAHPRHLVTQPGVGYRFVP